MEDTLKIFLTYIPITIIASVVTTFIRWCLFHALADKLEKHLQGPTRRFVSYLLPILLVSTIIFLILMLFNFSQSGLSIKLLVDNYKGSNMDDINLLIFMFVVLYLVIIFVVQMVIMPFRKDVKRLWYIVGNNNSRVYIYKKSFNNTYISYIVPNDSKNSSTRTFLSFEDLNYPNEILYNQESEIRLKRFWRDIPSSKDTDINIINRHFNFYIVLLLFFPIIFYIGNPDSLWTVAISCLFMYIIFFIAFFPFFRAKLFRYVLKRRTRILKWKFKKWKKYGYKKFNIDKKY